ncbi:MAG: DUF1722 domain-containing protein [Candidatus Scalindua rubra]|uniref:Pyrimidine dimer DNA glycosylase n=1 Tax=Candidatus Scalindua brodae TaxID=237368 RepID=A0A0B0EF51_9BACT|nr:MAG: Pyrimidine dimer DNA glycosylase [Candidatus Scalindua brodae]MBZ0108555.1 DUF1722 domain-containing protein [Candidatus Scalindua rubra]
MRIWDINPGYLNRQSLLGEHRELHGIVSIIVNKKKGYSHHPETVRWFGYGWALRQRHRLLAAEMSLRGFNDKSPVFTRTKKGVWPETYIDEPFQQFKILESKYQNKEQGRILLPKTAQQLWRHHKYSVLARDVKTYKTLGRDVSVMKPHHDFSELAKIVTELLRTPPSIGGMRNALQHMWGYVSDFHYTLKGEVELWSLSRLMEEIQLRSLASKDPYLTSSTALSELKVWMPNP